MDRLRLAQAFGYGLALACLVSSPAAASFSYVMGTTGGSWILTGHMHHPRVSPMAVMLPNGDVLVAGGFNRATLSSAELFDPRTSTWTLTGSMHVARSAATLTLLPSGKVLVAGGFNGMAPGVTASAEIYDPATGLWTKTGSMLNLRANHTATLLTSGMVLVAGGVGQDQVTALSTAELYDSATGQWTTTGSMNFPRERHGAVRLLGGGVLVTGGNLDFLDGPSGSTEVYNPASGMWSVVGRMTTSRRSHTETLLADGSVLVAGGAYGNIAASNFLASTDRFDPQAGVWSQTGDMRVAKGSIPTISGMESHTATLLQDGRVLVAGGDGFLTNFTNDVIFSSAELYDPATGRWALTGSLNVARSEHAAVELSDGRVLAIGGSGLGVALASTEIYTPPAPTFQNWRPQTRPVVTQFRPLAHPMLADSARRYIGRAPTQRSAHKRLPSIGQWNMTGSMHVSRIGAPMTLLPTGKVLIEGCDAPTVSGVTAELFDPSTGKWSRTGSMHEPRCNHVAVLLGDGRVLVAGGFNTSIQSEASAEIYDPATGSWTRVPHMNSTRYFASAQPLPNGDALVAGGNAINGIPRDSADLFIPSLDRWAETPSLNLSRNDASATTLPSGEVLVYGGFTQNNSLTLTTELYDPVANDWTLTGSTEQQALHVITLLTGAVLSMDEPGNGPTGTTSELYDPSTGTWTPTLGKMKAPRVNDTATRLTDGRVMATGGCTGFQCIFVARVELFDTSSQTWSLDAALKTPRESHSAVLLPSGQVLVAGGYDANLQPLSSAEIYTP